MVKLRYEYELKFVQPIHCVYTTDIYFYTLTTELQKTVMPYLWCSGGGGVRGGAT